MSMTDVPNVRVFIGAPADDNGLAVALQRLLERTAAVHVWNQGTFEPNKGNLENLLEAIDSYDFACFLAPGIDKITKQGAEYIATRDNIIFEYGLFLGRLGPDRVFLIRPRDDDLTLPSDLTGVTHLDYKPLDADNPPNVVLAPAAQVVQEKIAEGGVRVNHTSRRYSPVLEHDMVDSVAGLSDAALYFLRSRYGYKDEIRQLILNGKVIPSLYYYATEEGAEFWLNMLSDQRYRFKNNSIRLLKRVAEQIAEAVIQNAPADHAVDLVSLGSGDGRKDRVLLKGFSKVGPISLTYYPLDISDALLVECVRHIHGQSHDYADVRTRAIIADFLNLDVLRSVYEDRGSPNLFSILGNTFGNTDEPGIMLALQESMYEGDFVLIEINTDVDEVGAAKSFLTDDVTLRYSCIPIEMIGANDGVPVGGPGPMRSLVVFCR